MKLLTKTLFRIRNWLYDLRMHGNVLPPNVTITKAVDGKTMDFTLSIALKVNQQGNRLAVNINELSFVSANETGRKYIDAVDPTLLRHSIALMALATSQHVYQSPDSAYKKMDFTPHEQAPDEPLDPKLLN